jgi:hypothetical protein
VVREGFSEEVILLINRSWLDRWVKEHFRKRKQSVQRACSRKLPGEFQRQKGGIWQSEGEEGMNDGACSSFLNFTLPFP